MNQFLRCYPGAKLLERREKGWSDAVLRRISIKGHGMMDDIT